MDEYVFFDIETPNRHQDRICSIGIIRTDNLGRELYSRNVLVNPETGFDEYNMAIHHIAPVDVKNEVTFFDLWSTELADVFSNAILVAHNARFDMAVLGKTLDAYCLPKPTYNHVCTYNLARQNIPSLLDYSLPTVSEYFGVNSGIHHNALDDAKACNGVFWSMMQQWGAEACESIPYVWADTVKSHRIPENSAQALTDLYGLVIGLSLDGAIEPNEFSALTDWMERNASYSNTPFFQQSYSLLRSVLADNEVSINERNEILSLTRPFAMNEHNKFETVAMQQLIGIMRGISADGVITKRELVMLQDWLDDHEELHNNKTFLLVFNLINKALDDGVIDTNEERTLLDLFSRIINPIESEACNDESITFEGRSFVLSGNFSAGPKCDVESYIEAKGGSILRNVSGKVAYVVIGGEECERFAFGIYGTKAKKAMDLQAAGNPIQIIQEGQLGM